MDLFSALSSLATAGALIAAIWQVRQGVTDARARDEDRRVERALVLYQSVVAEGATYEGFHRLSVLLRRLGSARFATTTWYVLSDSDLATGGCLDPGEESREQAFADLYTVLWFFERSRISVHRGLVNPDVLMSTLGFHFWWWGQILHELRGPKATEAVRELAQQARLWAETNGCLEDWMSRCSTDFNGGPARDGDVETAPLSGNTSERASE
jgi:hypothetical protein